MGTAVNAYRGQIDQSKRDALIMAHLALVRHTVGRVLAHLPPGVDVENLEAAGTLGLVEAASKFNPERGIKFESFASMRIRGAVLDELRRNCPLPQHLLERMAKVRKAYKELTPPVTLEALASATALSQDDVADCLSAMRMTRMLSWDNLTEPLKNQALDEDERPERRLEHAEQKRQLARALIRLEERERLVVTMYYLEDLRLKEIGALLQLSESRISRLLQQALFNLGEFMRAEEAREEAGR